VKIFGIDPGSERTGYGCIEVIGGRHHLVICGSISAPAHSTFPDTLKHIHGDLATLLGLSESATSHQLRLLRTLRLVRARRAGRMVFYALDDRHIVTLFKQGLRHVEEAAADRPGRRLA